MYQKLQQQQFLEKEKYYLETLKSCEIVLGDVLFIIF